MIFFNSFATLIWIWLFQSKQFFLKDFLYNKRGGKEEGRKKIATKNEKRKKEKWLTYELVTSRYFSSLLYL